MRVYGVECTLKTQLTESQAPQDIQTQWASPSVRAPETHNSQSLYDQNSRQLPPTAPFLPFQTAIDRFFEGGDNGGVSRSLLSIWMVRTWLTWKSDPLVCELRWVLSAL